MKDKTKATCSGCRDGLPVAEKDGLKGHWGIGRGEGFFFQCGGASQAEAPTPTQIHEATLYAPLPVGAAEAPKPDLECWECGKLKSQHYLLGNEPKLCETMGIKTFIENPYSKARLAAAPSDEQTLELREAAWAAWAYVTSEVLRVNLRNAIEAFDAVHGVPSWPRAKVGEE